MKSRKVMKNHKKLIAFVLTVVMLFSTITTFAAVDFDVNGTGDASNFKYFDFEDGNAWGGCSTNVVDADAYHNKVLKITPTESTSYANPTIGTDSTKGAYMISFDYKASTTDHIYQMFFRNAAGSDFALIYFDHNGKIVVSKKSCGVWTAQLGPANIAGEYYNTIGSYSANKWENISAVVTTNAGVTSMDWYINGALALSTDIGGDGSNLAQVFARSSQEGLNLLDGYGPLTYDGTENLLIDNFRVSYVEEYSKFYGTIASTKNNTVAVKFNEPLSANNNFAGVKVKSIDGTEVETGSVSFVGDTMYIPLTGTVNGGMEYAVVLPDTLSSVLGKKIANNALYFGISSEATSVPVYNKVKTFDGDTTIGADSSKADKYNRFYETGFLTRTWHGISPYDSGDPEHGIVADVNLQSDEFNGPTTADSLQWYNIHDGIKDGNITDEEVFSMDIYFDELNNRAYPMYLITGTTPGGGTDFAYSSHKLVAAFTVNANGGFVINNHAINGADADLRPNTHVASTNNYYDVIPNVFTTDKWYTIKMIVSKKAKTVTTYVGSKNENGVYEERLISTTPVAYSEYDYISQFMIQDHASYNFQGFYMDNLKYGYNLMSDGVYASANDVTVTAAASETEALKEQKFATFNYEGTLNNNYMVSFDVTTNNPNFNNNTLYLMTNDNNILCMIRTHQNGKIQISTGSAGWIDDALHTDASYPISTYPVRAGKSFNMLFNVDKTAKTADVFLDGVLIKKVTLGDNTSTDFDIKKVLIVAKNDKSATGDTTNNTGTAGTTATLSDVKISYFPITNVRSVRLIDASGEEFGTDSANIYNTINKIKAYYDGDITAENFVSSGVTLKNSNNEDIAVTSTYDSAEKSVTATITNGSLPNGTYTVTFNAVTGAKSYTATFKVNDTRKVEFKNFKLLKNGVEITKADDIVKGDTISVVVDAKNEHWDTQKFNVILCEYSAGDETRLEQVEFVEKTVATGGAASVADGELEITTLCDVSIIKAFIWKDFTTVEPLVNHIYKYPNSGTVSCTSDKILYNGRFKLVEDGDSAYMQSNWQRANIRLKTVGNGVTLHFQNHDRTGVMKLYVNGELKNDNLADKMYNANINISEYLSKGTNDILVTFDSEDRQRGFKGVTAAEGTWLDTPTPRDLNLMFIGPSTTASDYSFALKIPFALNADFTTISRSAIALRDGRGPSYYNGMETMFDYYGSVNRGEDGQDVLLDTTPFDHVAVDKDKFDMIFVQIGINDKIGVLADGSIETDGADRQDFYDTLFGFVKKLHTLYPSAKIILMRPFDTLDDSAAADYRRETFDLIDDDMLKSEGLTEANGYYYISTSGWELDYADKLHPSDEGQTTATEMILEILREKNLID